MIQEYYKSTTELEDIFFVISIRQKRKLFKKSNEGFFDKAWNFVDSDEGAAALVHYFKNEVVIDDPTIFQKRAPQTNDLLELLNKANTLYKRN